MTHEHPEQAAPITPQDWDTRYDTQHIWSGNPNSALVAEASSLAPGAALDVGCGEGADAVWLAQRGWAVTGVDVSRVAVDRAREAAASAGVEVHWRVEDFLESPYTNFDLVSAQYPAIPRTPHQGVERHFAQAVKPGGVLLFVHHVLDDRPHGFDPADYVMPDDMAWFLAAEGWEILGNDARERHVTEGAGAHHSQDRVVMARRPSH